MPDRSPDTYAPDRSLTLTDGVVAIALTLLALDLKPDLSTDASSRALWDYLRHHSGQYLSFFIAFWVVSRFWLVHHRVLRSLRGLDARTLSVNLYFLFAVTLVPLTTYLNGAYDNALGRMLFALNLMLVALTVGWMNELVHRRGLIEEPEDEHARRLRHWRLFVSAGAPAAVAGMAWVVGSYAALFYLLLFLSDNPPRFVVPPAG